MKIYYFILKNYKGIFKKKHKGNTHLLMVPISEDKYLYLGVLGKILEEDEDTYACQLIVKLPKRLVNPIIVGEEDYFKERFILMESLPCDAEKISSNEFLIHMEKYGKKILSDISVEYNPKYNTGNKKIFTVQGDFNFISSDIQNEKNMGMIANKQLAYMGSPKSRFSSFQNFKI